MVNQAVAAYGKVDILYNSAAIEIRGSATQLSEADWDATMSTNVKGCWLCCKYTIPEMQKVGGGVHHQLGIDLVLSRGGRTRGLCRIEGRHPAADAKPGRWITPKTISVPIAWSSGR